MRRTIVPILLILFSMAVPALALAPGNQWIQISTGAGSQASGYATFEMGTTTYIVGGIYGTTYVPWSYKATNGYSFTLVAAYPTNITTDTEGRADMAYAVFDNKMWIMGGKNSTTNFNDTLYSVDGDIWITANASSGWPARAYAVATVYNGKLWLTGGYNTSYGFYYSDVWFLTTANETLGIWTRSCANCAPATGATPMIVLNGKMWILAGVTGGIPYSSTDGITWTAGSGANPILDRAGAGLAVTSDDTAVLAGGLKLATAALTNEVDTSTDGISWTAINTSPEIPAQYLFGMINRSTPINELSTPWHGYEGIYLYDVRKDALLNKYNINTWVSLPPPNASATPASASGTAPFPVAWSDTSAGYATTWSWDFKDGYFSYVQNASHVFTSPGTYAVAFTPLSPFGDSVFTSNITATTQQSQIIYYTQHQVRFRVVDANGVPIPDANIVINYVASSLPSTDTSWLISAFGVSPLVASEMTNSSVAMIGLTGDDGSSTFVMFPSLYYLVTLSKVSIGLAHHVTISPQDSDYTIYTVLPSQATQNSTYMPGHLYNTTLFVTEPTASTVTFNLIYYDPSGLTTSLDFNVTCWDNKTPMYYITFIPGTSVVKDSNYTVPNVKGQEWRMVFNATRSAPL
jgi:PKD repeat protein